MTGLVRRFRRSEIGRLFKDSFYSGIWQGATAVADLVQIVLITHQLGLSEYGKLAIAIAFVVIVGQFFDLRVGVATTVAAARHIDEDPRRAAGVFQMSYLVDSSTGLLGFAVVAFLAPFVGPSLVGSGGTTLILLFALTLLVSTIDESSFTILRLLDRFRLIAVYTTALEALRIALVVVALAVFGTIESVALALVVQRAIAGLTSTVIAAVVFRRASGGISLTRPALAYAREDRAEMLRTMLHTNVVSYARLAQVQLPTVVLGAVSGASEAAVYKVGMAAANAVGKLADPAYIALLPRLARLWSAGRRAEIRRLIARLSAVSIPATAIAAVVLIVLRDPILRLLGGGEAGEAAGTVLILGAIAQVINAGLLWNIATLFAARQSRVVSRLAFAAAVVQTGALIPLANSSGADGAALAFLIGMVVVNVPATLLALRALRGEEMGVADLRDGNHGTRTWARALAAHPVALVAHRLGRPELTQDTLALAAAKHLYGSDVDLSAWREALRELSDSDLVPPAGDVGVGISHQVTLGRWLYAAVRTTRPDVVIETGVARGTSSWLILNALRKNGTGRLYSIDLPDHDPAMPYNVGHERRTGSVVPETLRDRWKLILADSAEALPEVIEEVDAVGLFFHDSEHTYEAMRREFLTVLPNLAPGGLIVSDDIQKNAAFADVTTLHGLRSFVFRKGGTARKPAR
jgi:O-antigen/teichoic acid export membrane protein/predicted O-methyltransferase YrrM